MGKSSGGIRNAGKNTRKSNSINRQVETYSYEYNGEKYTFKIEKNEYKVDRVIEYVNGEKSGRDFNVKSFLENINRSENKNLQKVSSENLLKSVNFEKPQKSDYDKIKKAIELDFKKRNSFISNKSSAWKFVKFEKNYNGTYDAIYNSPLQKNVRMTWSDLKAQAKMK